MCLSAHSLSLDLPCLKLPLSKVTISGGRVDAELLATVDEEEREEQDHGTNDVDSDEDILHAHLGDPWRNGEHEDGR